MARLRPTLPTLPTLPALACALACALPSTARSQLSWKAESADTLTIRANSKTKTHPMARDLGTAFELKHLEVVNSAKVEARFAVGLGGGTATVSDRCVTDNPRGGGYSSCSTGPNRVLLTLRSTTPKKFLLIISPTARGSTYSATVDIGNDGSIELKNSDPTREFEVQVPAKGLPILVTTTLTGPIPDIGTETPEGTLTFRTAPVQALPPRLEWKAASRGIQVSAPSAKTIATGLDLGVATTWSTSSFLTSGYSSSASYRFRSSGPSASIQDDSGNEYIAIRPHPAASGPNKTLLKLFSNYEVIVVLTAQATGTGAYTAAIDIGNDGTVDVVHNKGPVQRTVRVPKGGLQILVTSGATSPPMTSRGKRRDLGTVTISHQRHATCTGLPFGRGCGAPGPTLTASGPTLPNDFTFTIRGARPRETAVFAFGQSQLDLPLFFSSCRLHTELSLLHFVRADALGRADVRVRIPVRFFALAKLQGFSVWNASGATRITSTNGLATTCW